MPINIQIQTVSHFPPYQTKLEFTILVNILKKKIIFLIFSKELPGIYKWETRFPERNLKSTYIGPSEFKEPPKHYAFSSNWPKENYSPLFTVKIRFF